MAPKTPTRPGVALHDRVLAQRLENCLEAPSLRDLDDVVEYLRDTFPEYRRQKTAPFKQTLFRLQEAIALRRPELFEARGRATPAEEEPAELTAEPGEPQAVSSLNQSMMRLYGQAQESDGSAAPRRDELKSSSANDVREGISELQTPMAGKRSGNATSRPSSKKARVSSKRLSSSVTTPRAVRYENLGGIEEVLDSIKELVEYPLKHPEVYAWLGVEPPRGVLLHGPPGCGKTALANAIANECGVPFLRISAPEVVSGMSGESEAKIRSLFQEAASLAPCIVFIDEIDAIAPKRESAQREMERRIVAQLLTCMDDLTAAVEPSAEDESEVEKSEGPAMGKHVIVIGATNRPDSIDSALRRAGRFDREIPMGIPSEAARARILRVISGCMRLEGSFDFDEVAKKTPGFVGADLMALMKEAAALAVQRIFRILEASETKMEDEEEAPEPASPRLGKGPLSAGELENLAVTMQDVQRAVEKVQPSVRREGFATVPNTSWEDVGSLDEVREELEFAVIKPIAHPDLFSQMGLQRGSGVLLFGPPGCGKTLVAKAAANASGANFISIKGPELLNKYVGESERAVRQLFARAQAAAPCVLFFDELDALAPRRGSEASQATERLVNQLLTEMDGVDGRTGVFLIAATNRPDIIDPALLRPGRLDKVLYVPLPNAVGRASILQALSRGVPLAADTHLDELAGDPALEGFSGADLSALLREASVLALKQSLQAPPASGSPQVRQEHLQAAKARVQPSVSDRDQKMYLKLRDRLRSSRGHLAKEENLA